MNLKVFFSLFFSKKLKNIIFFNFQEEEEKKNRENADSIIAKILAEEEQVPGRNPLHPPQYQPQSIVRNNYLYKMRFDLP